MPRFIYNKMVVRFRNSKRPLHVIILLIQAIEGGCCWFYSEFYILGFILKIY